jgi:hypothetical protein
MSIGKIEFSVKMQKSKKIGSLPKDFDREPDSFLRCCFVLPCTDSREIRAGEL